MTFHVIGDVGREAAYVQVTFTPTTSSYFWHTNRESQFKKAWAPVIPAIWFDCFFTAGEETLSFPAL